MSAQPVISSKELTKRFGDQLAVDRVNLDVKPGEIFGFLGPNGAGKTTLIMMLLGLLRPSSGTIHVLGEKMDERALALRMRVGVVSEHQSFYGDMTADAYLKFFANMYAVSNAERRICELLKSLDLDKRRYSQIKSFSKGMQQKLAMARSLLHSPELLVMDEPASGLDPYGISQIRELIYQQKRDGKTVFLSSHILSEIEQTADRVAIIKHGVIVSQGSIGEIRTALAPQAKYILDCEGDGERIQAGLSHVPGLNEITQDGAKLVLSVDNGHDARADISRAVVASGGVVLGLAPLEMSLEEAFLTITNDRIEQLSPAPYGEKVIIVDGTDDDRRK